MEDKRETAPITPTQAEGERGDRGPEEPIAPRTPGQAEGERRDVDKKQ